MTSQTFKFIKVAKATPSMTYGAFTNATALKEWLCDIATVLPRVGGRVFLAWNSGFFTCGEYTALEPDRKVAFSWRGRIDPSASQVRVSIDPVNEGTRITLEHTVEGEGDAWAEIIREIEDGWRGSLENLVSVLETGEDLRLTLRPMLGITITDFNAEIAAKEGIPVSKGMRLDGVIDGMGAKAAGLMPNDVIVGMAGRDIRDFADLATALQRKRAGDVVDVEIYRGSEKMTLAMQLSRRPIPAIPTSIDGLSVVLRERWRKIEAEADAFFVEITDELASFKPTPEEWSVKEVLAHFIQGERGYQNYICGIVDGQELWSDDFGGNQYAYIKATVSVYPMLSELVVEFKRSHLETIALFENLPSNFVERKGSYWRVAYNALEDPYHFHTHLDQMRASLEAARKAA
ncbi:MAG: hypothetical protein A2Z16_06320 [Chloroflexi bacterium RBG_16_54_18]|nr:MAG: hypothetical protein A2Z16_06320 [Chloroflexi bacterium RBG_16_54_18]